MPIDASLLETSCYSKTQRCFFTSDASMRKDRFMQQINQSSHEGGLTCSFNDYQLAEFVQHKLRNLRRLPHKKAVHTVGPQQDGYWVLGPSLYFNDGGELVDADNSDYTWLGQLYEGPGIAPKNAACIIHLPLCFNALTGMYLWARINMKHNFIPCMLVAGSYVMAMHYTTILKQFLFCPVPLAYGVKSGTGKTTASIIGQAPTGAYPSRFVSRASSQKYTEMCCSSYLPLAVDDPKSRSAISDLSIALFNGATEATIKHGTRSPHSMAVITANFTTIDKEK